MGAATSHEEATAAEATPRPPLPPPPPPPPQRRPTLGPRPSNLRQLSPALGDSAALPAALFRDSGRPPRDLRPIEYRPPVQQSEIVRNVVSIIKPSLRLVRADGDPFVYLVEFEFDALVEGYITVYYCAKEIIRRTPGARGRNAPVAQVSYAGKNEELPAKTRFAIGRKQKYQQKADKGLDVRKFTSTELRYKSESDRYPVVIRLEAKYPKDSSVPEHLRVKSQTTFGSVSAVEGTYQMTIVAQQVLVRDTIHRVQDMYGIGATDVTAKKDSDMTDTNDAYKVEGNHECVICLTEASNTAVLPCNHLCLCDDCARILCTEMDYQRRKCPVCRTQLGSLLRIISTTPQMTNDESTAVNAGSAAALSRSVAATTSTRSGSDVPLADIATASPQIRNTAADINLNSNAGSQVRSEGGNEGNTLPTASSTVV